MQSLGNSRERSALDALVALTDGGRTVFGRQKVAAKTVVLLAALRALALSWRSHPHAAALLASAASASDDDIREAVR